MTTTAEWVKIKQWLLGAKSIIETLKAKENATENDVREAICTYIQHRYMLDRCPKPQESIYVQAEESAAIMAGLPQKQLHEMEAVSGCTGAKSAMVKKVLLLMSLNEMMGWHLSEKTCMEMETVQDIIDFAYHYRYVTDMHNKLSNK